MQSWDTRICLVRDGGIGPFYVDALYEASSNLGRIVVESIRAYQIECGFIATLAMSAGAHQALSQCSRRVHPSTVNTHQQYSPVGLDLEVLKRPLKTP